MRIHDIVYYCKCRLFKKYNRVTCKKLPPTWVDRDHLLLHCCFQILEDFVHDEKGHFYDDVYEMYKGTNEEYALARDKDWKELRELYYWWQDRKEKDAFWFENYEEDNKQLVRLISLRELLWT